MCAQHNFGEEVGKHAHSHTRKAYVVQAPQHKPLGTAETVHKLVAGTKKAKVIDGFFNVYD